MLTLVLLLALLPVTAQAGLDVPVIRLNSTVLKHSEMVLQSGTRFSLSCEGQAAITWRTRLAQHRKHLSKNVLTVRQSTANHTGTYRCSYKNHTDLFSEVHIYVRDPAHLFTWSVNPVVTLREGSSCLLDCLLTDPSATVFSLCQQDGSPIRPKLNYTANPKQGIRIQNLQLDHSGEYVCSATLNTTRRLSTVYHLTVTQRVVKPPSVFMEMDELVRIVGEKLKISCFTSNINHAYHITWHHSSKKVPPAETVRMNSSDVVRIKSVLTLSAVNMSDSGNLTCTAGNTIGQNSSTVSLTVVEKPYVLLTPGSSSGGCGTDVEVKEGEHLELSINISAYPPILETWWDTPTAQNSSTYRQIHRRYHRSVARLSLARIRADESGWYIFSARSAHANASTHFKVFVIQKPSVEVRWRNGTLTCIVSGFPPPTVHWRQCEQLQITDEGCSANDSSWVELEGRQRTLELADEFGPSVVESVLVKSEIVLNRTVECVGVNTAGESQDSYSTGGLSVLSSTSEDLSSQVFLTLVGGVSVVSTLLLLLLGVCVYRCKQKPRYEIRWKIIEANDGNNYTYIDPNQLPYNSRKWEFPRDRLTFGQVLGAGAFGKVVEAAAYGLDKDDHVTRVAVKMLKSSALSEEKEALMSELKILSHLGPHANIVNLLGACTQGGPVLLITEYCSHGDLLNFLRRRAEVFLNSVLQEHDLTSAYKNLPVHQSPDKGISTNSYQDMLGRRGRDGPQEFCEVGLDDPWMLDLDHLIRFSSQVARGLDFLSSKNCIHRDVAARNVLVTEGWVVKICDFGLARDIMNDSNYVVRGNARLPVKWMSPESIFECIYTVQSDVWSYGILLWEIFSLGRSPYPDVAVDARFYKMIKSGYHMTQPDFAPPEIYTVMKMCWSLEPTSRPTFGKIVQLIAELLPEFSDQWYQNLQPELLSESSDSPKACSDQQDQEEAEPLMQLNNYQLC